MVSTANQMTAFFEHNGQMHATVVQMAIEGIATIDDLTEFDKDSLQSLADSLGHPPGRAPDPNPNAACNHPYSCVHLRSEVTEVSVGCN